ncbi:putative permease [Methylophaga frappieri]|uniref:Putative permease n=1 Tax=Methylophaga frappieri (strain ATCC BAA-2434 / DSM 25690 / JAM7) TaxID=754477 RepID=I1YE53_METFJ|nr:AEC family transporter [Methylophaga frappieri]AFJ01196.1 putative permease [Methylophaga frappieri]
MFSVLTQMAVLIACGALWHRFAPQHISSIAHRRALTDLVFYILLPALIIDVIWQTDLNAGSVQISLIALSALASAMFAMWLVLRWLNVSQTQTGALLLAASFPNVTYLGLPVLDQALGSWSNSLILQYDLFACTPVLMTAGILLARHFGDQEVSLHPLKALLRIPPLWAVTLAVMLNLLQVPRPEILHHALATLSGGVVPLMLIALGMSIRWQSFHFRLLPLLLPVALISLVLAPAVVWGIVQFMPVTPEVGMTVVLAAAMPTMVFGFVICEQYGLDSSLYAAAVALTTILCLATLPVWFYWVS